MDLLPPDNILLILDKLSIDDIVKLCNTSTYFHELCKSKEVTRLLKIKADQLVNPNGYNIDDLKQLIRKPDRIKILYDPTIQEFYLYDPEETLTMAYNDIISSIYEQVKNKNFNIARSLLNREINIKKTIRVDYVIPSLIRRMIEQNTIDVDILDFLLNPELSDNDNVVEFIEHTTSLLVENENIPILKYLFTNYYIPSDALYFSIKKIQDRLRRYPNDNISRQILDILLNYKE